jgi:transposase InsO family protein
MIRVNTEIKQRIAREMSAAANSKPIAERYAALYGASLATVYRWAASCGFRKRKKRRDAGKSVVTYDIATKAAAFITQSQRKNGKYLGTSKYAVRLLETNGIIEPGTVTPANLSRRMIALGISKRHLDAPDPVTQLQSLYPNHVHQVDVSVCPQQYPKQFGRQGIWLSDRIFYKNKIKKFKALVGKKILHRYVLTDHCTGAIEVRYYWAPGEDTESLLDFLYHAWREKDDRPFCGVPKILMTDQGPSFKAGATQDLMKNFGIEWLPHMPRNPRATGQVECGQNIVERDFEAGFREKPADTVEEMNDRVSAWMLSYNGCEKHTRHNHTRYGLWSARALEHLKLPPRDFDSFKACALSKPEERTVTHDRTILYDNGSYLLHQHPEYLFGDKILIRYSPFDYPDIVVENKTREAIRLNLPRASFNAYGFRDDAVVIGDRDAIASRPKHTITQHAKKDIVAAREALDKIGIDPHIREMPNVEFLKPAKRAVEIEPDIAPVLIPIPDARRIVMEHLGVDALDTETLRFLNREWAAKDAVEKSEIDDICHRLDTEQIGGPTFLSVEK